jgi:hypothetical protein
MSDIMNTDGMESEQEEASAEEAKSITALLEQN